MVIPRAAISTGRLSSRIFPRRALQLQGQIIKPISVSYHSTTQCNEATKVDEIFDKILQLDTIEVALLTQIVNEKMGFSQLSLQQQHAMSVGRGGGSGGAATADPEEEKKTAFDLKLTGFDAKSKIKVIKEIRAITGLGLKEAKEMVEGAPKTVKSDIKMEEAEELKAKLEGVGGTVEIS